MEFRQFDYKTRRDLEQDMAALENGFPLSGNLDILHRPLSVGGVRLKNRLLIQPMEGMDAEEDGAPSSRTLARYWGFAGSGAGCVWVESVSVNRQGRSSPHQLWLRPENAKAFARLAGAMKQDGDVYIVLQLTHSGRSSSPDGVPAAQCAFHNPCIPRAPERIISDDELEQLEDDYLAAAKLAAWAGFDAVDIRSCHGYLINELFSAINRPGKYGGPFENRVRLLLNIVDKVQKGAGIEVAVRLNLYDGLPWPFGWGIDKQGRLNLQEPLALVELLTKKGVRLLNVSNGIGAHAPYIIRPYDKGGPVPLEHPLEGIARMQHAAKKVKQAATEAIVIASAFSWLREYGPYAAAGGIEAGWYDVAGFGRQALAYPDFMKQLDKMQREKCCRTCSACTAFIKNWNKLRCVMHA